MHDLVDSIFTPALDWLNSIYDRIHDLSVPAARPLDLGKYLGHISFLGPTWMMVVTQTLLLSFVYLVTYIIVANIGLFRKFKDMVKWW